MKVKEVAQKPSLKKKESKIPKPKKIEGKSSKKKVSPPKAEKAVTMEWDFTKKSDKTARDREKILSELEKKSQAKKAQTKLDI